MKVQATLAIAAACVGTAAAFTVGRPALGVRSVGAALQRTTSQPTRSFSTAPLRMSGEADYVKNEIASADVSVLHTVEISVWQLFECSRNYYVFLSEIDTTSQQQYLTSFSFVLYSCSPSNK